MVAILTLKPGLSLVGGPIRHKDYKADFLKLIETPVIVHKDDPEDVREVKRAVIEARMFVKEAIDNGEDPARMAVLSALVCLADGAQTPAGPGPRQSKGPYFRRRCRFSKAANTTPRRSAQGRLAPSAPTVKKHLDYLESAFLFDSAQRFDVRGKRYLNTPSKYFVVDVGLRNVCVNFREPEQTHLMENVVYTELRRRGYSVDVGGVDIQTSENGRRTFRQHEIDFILNNPSRKIYIQSAFNIDDPVRRAAETPPPPSRKRAIPSASSSSQTATAACRPTTMAYRMWA